MKNPQDLDHGGLCFRFADIGAFTRKRDFIDEQSRQVTGNRIRRIDLDEVGAGLGENHGARDHHRSDHTAD